MLPTAPAVRRAGAPRNHPEMDREDALILRIEAETYRQVQDLQIECDADHVVVTGRSRTYYTKQLATQAVLAVAPGAKLENEIVVVAG